MGIYISFWKEAALNAYLTAHGRFITW